MKIAILYICIGKYDIFWKEFYSSCEKHYLTDHEKHYFIFTDSPLIKEENFRMHIIFQSNLNWPFNTLMRFKFFHGIESELLTFDYIYFLNSNIQFVAHVGEEVFPSDEENGLLAVLHPGYFDKTIQDFPYERDKRSRAYISEDDGKHYLMGGFNGGKTKEYLKLVKELYQNIEIDLSKNIIAIWHDESHLNAYLLNKNYRILSPEYGFPEGCQLPFKPKILILDKAKFGGHQFMRGITTIKIGKMQKKKMKIIIKELIGFKYWKKLILR